MTASRTCGLVASVTVLALGVVYLRTEQSRSAARRIALETRWVELRRELWKFQTGVARLRAPSRLYDSLDRFGADVVTRDLKKDSVNSSRFAGKALRD